MEDSPATSQIRGVLGITASDREAPDLEIWRVRSIPFLQLLSDPLWPGVVTFKVPSMGQIDLFENYLYLIGLCVKEKKTFKKLLQKNLNMNVQWMWFSNL